jgi:hypothetical protein
MEKLFTSKRKRTYRVKKRDGLPLRIAWLMEMVENCGGPYDRCGIEEGHVLLGQRERTRRCAVTRDGNLLELNPFSGIGIVTPLISAVDLPTGL